MKITFLRVPQISKDTTELFPVNNASLTARLSLLAALGLLIFFSISFATPGFDTLVNYDTAWTYVYDGGKDKDGSNIYDNFYDVKMTPDGGYICVGASGDSTTTIGQLVLLKLSAAGKFLWKKLYKYKRNQNARSIVIAQNGDFIVGGMRYGQPLVFRTDSLGTIKWSTWVYDSINDRQSLLLRSATVNCVRETSRGTIICTGGDYFTDANYAYGSTINNYAAFIEFSAEGKVMPNSGQLNNQSGYNIGGFDIEEAPSGYYLVAGNQALNYFDTNGTTIRQNTYSFMLDGVGSEVNNITRCKKLQNGTFIITGQAYEGNCWTRFNKLYYDAWWSPIDYRDGGNKTWDTAGYQGGDDRLNDFAQLANNNLVFVGKRNYSNSQTTGIWAYVTPDSGSRILWEGITAGPLYAGEPLSVCATPDSGFTVAGQTGLNAFAAHFVLKPKSATNSTMGLQSYTAPFIVRMKGKNLIVTNAIPKTFARVSLMDISGRLLAKGFGHDEIEIDVSGMGYGTYIMVLNADKKVEKTKKIQIGMKN